MTTYLPHAQKPNRFKVELKFKDTISVLLLQQALREAIEKKQTEQSPRNSRDGYNTLQDLKSILDQVKQYKPIWHETS